MKLLDSVIELKKREEEIYKDYKVLEFVFNHLILYHESEIAKILPRSLDKCKWYKGMIKRSHYGIIDINSFIIKYSSRNLDSVIEEIEYKGIKVDHSFKIIFHYLANTALSKLVLKYIDKIIDTVFWKKAVITCKKYLSENENKELIDSIKNKHPDKYIELVSEVIL